MPQTPTRLLEPRKLPVQARSTASVDAILEATIQVLLNVGKDRLTTTRVASRAGVSIGTLYQYFPNKNALLKAVLKRHLNRMTQALERVCHQQAGHTLTLMAENLVTVFLDVKMQDVKTSLALYAVKWDLDGAKITEQKERRSHKAMVEMLESSCQPLNRDPHLIASMMQSAMFGAGRRLLESGAPEKYLNGMRQELIVCLSAYLAACSADVEPL